MIEALVAKVFMTRNFAHQEHLRTKSYAQHSALGSFYEAVISDIDSIVEAYQGRFGLISVPSLPEAKAPKNITGWLAKEAEWIEENREEIANGSKAIENLVDNLTVTYLSTIYKLTHLS